MKFADLAIHGRILTNIKFNEIRNTLGKMEYDKVSEIILMLEELREDDWISSSSLEVRNADDMREDTADE